MVEVETCSWIFVCKVWNKLMRRPIPDKGFEESFREYLYLKINFDNISNVRDLGLGLSYSTFSGVSHELDAICKKKRNLFVFELKHYEVSNITKEIVFTFWGKVVDFYLQNAEILSNYKINLLLVTINRNIDDSIRKLCIALGIKLIEPSLMTLGTMDYLTKDLYQKISQDNSELKMKVEKMIEEIGELRDNCDYSFSDIFSYSNGKIQIDLESLSARPHADEVLDKISEYHDSFMEVLEIWKAERN